MAAKRRLHSLAARALWAPALAAVALVGLPGAAAAQDKEEEEAREEEKKEPRRYRIGLGAQMVRTFPGSDELTVRPLFDLSVARGSTPFAFEAPDESFDFRLVKAGGLEFGPVLNLEGSRKPSEVGADLDKVDTTIEAGGFVNLALGESFRLRAEGRQGLGGHDGFVGVGSADFILRDGDNYLFSIGPRVTYADAKYQRAYFGVTPAETLRTGVPTFTPDSGIQAVGAAASLIFQLSDSFGIYSYAKYDRLQGDAADSPVVQAFGSRNQWAGGLALTYTFGGTKNR